MENYAEYVDYNSTTTQSDRGDMLYTLLDYLRLRASYDRVAWNLQPVVLAHEVLVRSGHDEAADVWRAAVAERTSSIAEDHLKTFHAAEPQVRHAAAEHRRPAGRALRAAAGRRSALRLDRTGHGRGPRQTAAAGGTLTRRMTPSLAFARLEEGIEEFTRDISGAGFDVPAWLEALEQEVDRVLSDGPEEEELPDPQLPVVQVHAHARGSAAAGAGAGRIGLRRERERQVEARVYDCSAESQVA